MTGQPPLDLTVVVAARTGPNATLTFGSHDEPLDTRGQADATGLRLHSGAKAFVAPDVSARDTARLMGARDAHVEPALRAMDLGRWAGLRPDQVDPVELGQWFTDPAAAPHAGESVVDFVGRLAEWLHDRGGDDVAVVVAGGTAQGIVAAAIGADFFGIEVRPADVIRLRRRGGRWRLRPGVRESVNRLEK
ncbi:histidine phosphatase family protein [Williamsia muralis]|uniref:Histidine phosphatase family protein n=1 Tax=Williamsia marianensis TaxID=85044 RepID=A0ABU4ETS6_WILMA|nr:histidine phosphatase family protein [Williamsia muralis]MDV7134054.1 histidine phosphatase family protein [Williamsia muralis]